MRWQTSFLFLLLWFALPAKAQLKNAPPFFNGSNLLHHTEALAPLNEKLRSINDSNSQLRILHLGDSHVKSGFLSEPFSDSLNRYFLGVVGKPDAVHITVMAKNGATSKYFLSDVYNMTEVQRLQPDIIIISLGTNEAQNLYTSDLLQLYFSKLLEQVRQDAPSSVVVFTTPGDALRKSFKQVKKRKRYYTIATLSPNKVLPVVVDFIKDFAVKNNAAYWDWYTVMGGRGAIVRWVGHGYANADRIHLLENGYNLQGWLLATAFIKYFKTIITNP